ncbi:MAG: hypothetical protein WBW33_06990 [Bryobacteraceae bacterium]
MESNVETYAPAGLYARVAWFALAGAVGTTVIGFRFSFAFIPAFLFALTSVFLFWLASRPRITVAESQFTIGERAIAWREVKEINSSRFVSPLILDIRLTNNRRKRLVYPGEAGRIARLMYQLRRNSRLATFDGVAYRDYWTWTSLGSGKAAGTVSDQPVRMVSLDDEEEIERLYQRLKTVGHLDSRTDSKK